MKFLVLTLFLTVLTAVSAEDSWTYLDNGHIRLGVNLNAGACIGWFSASGSKENLLNAYDVGRYVQQSYYGDEDGSDWNGKPWRYNPVQGGGWRNDPAVVLESKVDAAKHELYAKTRPRHWGTGKLLEEVTMEQWLRLDKGLARMKFRMTYTGTQTHKARHQEIPALFVSPNLDTLVSCVVRDGILAFKQPAFPNEILRFDEPWIAWVNDDDQGLGLWCPLTSEATSYRVRNGNKGDCSYVAPIQTFALKPGLVFEYETALMLGSVEEIRSACNRLSQPGGKAPIAVSETKVEVQTHMRKNKYMEAVLEIPKVSRAADCGLRLRLRNTGKEVMTFAEPNGEAPIEMNFRRSDGLHFAYPPSPPPPDPAASAFDQAGATLRVGNARYVKLKPGESRMWMIQLKDYVLLEPGAYRLKLNFELRALPPFEDIEFNIQP
jgi:hypothetical protein